MRLGVTPIGGANWTGGAHYLANVLAILRRHPECGVEPVLLAGTDADPQGLAPLERAHGRPAIRSPAFDRRRATRNQAEAVLRGRVPALEAALQDAGVEVVFEWAGFYGWDLRLPVLAWIPDFQHRRLASLFTVSGWLHREVGFRLQLAGRRTVLLSSAAARRDLLALYPAADRRRIAVARFAALADQAVAPTPPATLRERYGLPARFFHLPNQFWRHKNHLVVVEALRRLPLRGDGPVVIATGATADAHHPDFFPGFMARVAALGLADRFRHLGLVPYADLLGLMRAAVAVVNPSFFEGWSTTVEEAKTLGTPLVLSALAVHREQAPQAQFFLPTDPAGLAALLARLAAAPPAAAPCAPVTTRIAAFARDFAAAVRLAAAHGAPGGRGGRVA